MMKIRNQSIFGQIKVGNTWKNTRIPINLFDPFSEKSLEIELIRLGFKPKKITRNKNQTPDFDIGNGYVVECTNHHGYFPDSLIGKTQKWLNELGTEFYTISRNIDNKIEPKILFTRKAQENTVIIRNKYDERSHREKIKETIGRKYGQCYEYNKRIINLNFINEPFNPHELFVVILSILREFGTDYQNLVAILAGLRCPPFSPILSYFIVENKDGLYDLPIEFKKISRVPKVDYSIVPIEYFFNFGDNSQVILRPPYKF
ncbi:MAG: hypothetical protein JSW00_11135 [Thermoplasmata archaeon]|nr:MAG: hypothetical protein JSW00_11135 [Thermoplasmata archaeon]